VARGLRPAARLRRVLVLGARGFFGRHAVALLRADGVAAVPVSHADADVEDRASLRSLIHANDVILDTVGPFQTRRGALLDVALEQRADLVDLSDSLAYARSVGDRSAEIAARGIAVLTGCSAISAVVATLVRASAIGDVSRVDAWLAPASRETANVATARSFLASVRSSPMKGCDFAPVRGMRVESALEAQLPAVWADLGAAAFWVDPHTRGARPLLALASRSAAPARGSSRCGCRVRKASRDGSYARRAGATCSRSGPRRSRCADSRRESAGRAGSCPRTSTSRRMRCLRTSTATPSP